MRVERRYYRLILASVEASAADEDVLTGICKECSHYCAAWSKHGPVLESGEVLPADEVEEA